MGRASTVQSDAGIARWLCRTVSVALGLALIWLTLRVGMAAYLVETEAARAFSWAPGDARVLAARAGKELLSGAQPAAHALAAEAIRRDATVVPAARTLGLLAGLRGDEAGAARLMRYAEGLSRRDLPTQLWLSQEAVEREDVRGALRHYGIALKTWGASQSIIFPVLVAATGDDRLVEPIADLVAHADTWSNNFLILAMREGPSAENLVALSEALARRQASLTDNQRAVLLNHLIKEEKFTLARSVYNAAQPRGAASRMGVVDGRFEQVPRFPPFDWSLADQPDLHADRVRAENGDGNMLSFAGENGMGGVVAKQLLTLSPGRYRFSVKAGNISSASPLARPRWQMRCAATGGTVFFDLLFPVADNRGQRFTADLHIPDGGCTAQWLSLLTPGDSDLESREPAWVDDVAIVPIG